MRALVKAGAGPGLHVRDAPKPAVGINDDLNRMLRTGICGTDVHIDSWGWKRSPAWVGSGGWSGRDRAGAGRKGG